MNVLYFYLFLLAHPYLAMWWKSFELAGRKSWEALIPGYNYFVAYKVFCSKPFWSLLLVFPGIHLVMLAVLNVSFIRRFGYFSLLDTIQGIFFPYLVTAKIAAAGDKILPETNWANSKEMSEREWGDHLVLFLSLPVIGHVIALSIDAVTRHQPGKKSKVKEWGDSLVFALVAASIIRTYVFEPFQIPTGSMEKTLLVGDFLFVNKLAYGPKVPVTPLSYPLVHNTVPWVNTKSYTSFEKSEYTRLPGFTDVSNYDVVVFNYPSGDTAIYDPRMPNGLMGHDYYQILNDEAMYYWRLEFERNNINKIRKFSETASKDPEERYYQFLDTFGEDFIDNIEKWKTEARKGMESGVTYCRPMPEKNQNFVEHYGLIYRPVDKRENYIKRCVAIPGDIVEIKQSELLVNDKKVKPFPHQNLQYEVDNIILPTSKRMDEKYDLEIHRGGTQNGDYYVLSGGKSYIMNLTQDQLNKMKNDFPEASFKLILTERYVPNDSIKATPSEMIKNLNYYPKDLYVNNTITDFNRFQVPEKGQTIKLSKDNIAWYRRIITAYEGHTLSEREDGIYIDGKKTDSYTFSMNYYWMMGDNRYNSADSRVWGFVPEDHIVGKASMVWFSKDPYQGIRWERLFTIIR